ncbi:MAG: hypothetical protein E6Q97_38035 [Desulfurellales bacterium]|nr:MAG: hypothetical protein E6Q97_38035 [Desulfurellales bacterium]
MIPGITAQTAPGEAYQDFNLTIANPGFETGDLTGWTTVRGVPEVVSSTGTISSAHSGTYWMAGGNTTGQSEVTQIIAVPSHLHDDIDADMVTLNYEAWLGAQTSEGDTTRFSVRFYNASDQIIGNYVPSAYSLAAWQLRAHSAKLPTGTRKVGLILNARRYGAGSYADGYFDDIAASFAVASPTTVELAIRNPSGDEGTTAGWTNQTASLACAAGASGDGTIALIGNNYWYAGNTARTVAYQQVAVPSTAHASIDAGTATLSWSYAQCCTGTDRQRVSVEFYASNGTTLLGSSTPAYASDGGANNWSEKNQGPVAIPTGTRFVRLINDMDRESGTSNDGYVDAIRAWITL